MREYVENQVSAPFRDIAERDTITSTNTNANNYPDAKGRREWQLSLIREGESELCKLEELDVKYLSGIDCLQLVDAAPPRPGPRSPKRPKSFGGPLLDTVCRDIMDSAPEAPPPIPPKSRRRGSSLRLDPGAGTLWSGQFGATTDDKGVADPNTRRASQAATATAAKSPGVQSSSLPPSLPYSQFCSPSTDLLNKTEGEGKKATGKMLGQRPDVGWIPPRMPSISGSDILSSVMGRLHLGKDRRARRKRSVSVGVLTNVTC